MSYPGNVWSLFCSCPHLLFLSPLFLNFRPVPVFCTLILSSLLSLYLIHVFFHYPYPTPILCYWLFFALRLRFVEGMKGYWESLVTEGEAGSPWQGKEFA